jgi:ProP effector
LQPTATAGTAAESDFTTMDTHIGTDRAAQAREIITVLAEFWPNAFSLPGYGRPLSTYNNLIEAAAGAITHHEIGAALRYYTNNLNYLRACYAGADRIDLNGQVVGRVTAHDAAQAATKLAQIRKLILARKIETPIARPHEIIALPERQMSLLDLD